MNRIKITISGKMWQRIYGKQNNGITKDILILLPRTYEYVRLHDRGKKLILQIKLGLLISSP